MLKTSQCQHIISYKCKFKLKNLLRKSPLRSAAPAQSVTLCHGKSGDGTPLHTAAIMSETPWRRYKKKDGGERVRVGGGGGGGGEGGGGGGGGRD
jgi:hypothetical protein